MWLEIIEVEICVKLELVYDIDFFVYYSVFVCFVEYYGLKLEGVFILNLELFLGVCYIVKVQD